MSVQLTPTSKEPAFIEVNENTMTQAKILSIYSMETVSVVVSKLIEKEYLVKNKEKMEAGLS